ncbi:MAG: peptidoglycan bridge formation glycyltransferase FemA/FemB family protein [Thermomicrobiales bacterium]
MTPIAPTAVRQTDITRNRAAWDQAVVESGGQLLQSWNWGEFKRRFAWDVARIAVPAAGGAALAQILFRNRYGVCIGYIPRGPIAPENDPFAATALWSEIDRTARRRRALAIIVEAERELPATPPRAVRLVPGPVHIQPARTVKIDLLDDEPLLAQMHQKTRYNIRLAQRRGVTVRRADTPQKYEVDTFYELLRDTSARNTFAIHDLNYYRQFLDVFGDDAALLFAEIEGKPVAGLIVTAFGDEAIYMYGASSTRDRAHGAGFLIQFEAMRWARQRGCRHYDLWGIPAQDPPTTQVDSGDRIAGTAGEDWRGLYEFKTRFGGQIVSYPPTQERQYWPLLASVARRFYATGG